MAEYPEKPVSFIVPWPPGDLEDVLTRMIAEDFQAEYGVSAAVVNKPGGGGGPFPGAIEVAQAPADGYTIGSFVIGVPVVGHQIGIDELTPEKFDPLGIFLTYPFVIATRAKMRLIPTWTSWPPMRKITMWRLGILATR
jgi:tripartite-type tricarboxylate transporter receptor subunit TctC